MYRRQGFTLVEVLFVLVIIATVMAYAVPSYRRTKDRAAYDAATGILVDVESAIRAMKRDLTMQNYASNFPDSGTKQITGTEGTVSLNNQTLKTYVGAQSTNAGRDTAFVKGLYTFGYLEPFTPKGYNYYAIRGNNATICNNKCRPLSTETSGESVVACMCKSSLVNTDCYYGAVFLNTGKIRPITGSSCRS